jgi:hypothetical protein
MSGPTPGEPFIAGSNRLSVGDLDATPGTAAWAGVAVLDNNLIPSPHILDKAIDFNMKVFFKLLTPGFPVPMPATFSVDFYMHGLDGVPVGGSPFAGGALVQPDTPAGAVSPGGGEFVTWASSTVTIPANTLDLNRTYRITIHGYDTVTNLMAFHDGTIIHTQD